MPQQLRAATGLRSLVPVGLSTLACQCIALGLAAVLAFQPAMPPSCRREGRSLQDLALFIDFGQMDHLQVGT